MNSGTPQPWALALAGPTASGKTAAALALADPWRKRGGVEIISVDSALVFRGMDIGTAKPNAAELAAVPHHLINIRDPLHAYSAAEFVRDAEQLMAQIRARGRMPLLVGGTMLYFKALFEGLSDMPPAHPEVRAALQETLAHEGLALLYARLQEKDPVTAARLAPADTQRILRALEVWQLTGRPISSFQTRDANAPARHDIALISLEPLDRGWLHQRIALRFDHMLEQGFVAEVEGLRARGDLHADLPSMRCVGYRQVWESLESHAPRGQMHSKMRDLGIFATRQLAKRQITWLRSMPHRHAVAADALNALPQVIALAQRLIPN
jgi:tRNA dimethylallyltransferase